MYTPIEVAKIFKVTRKTIYNWIESGKIKPIKIGNVIRIPKEEVERILRGE